MRLDISGLHLGGSGCVRAGQGGFGRVWKPSGGRDGSVGAVSLARVRLGRRGTNKASLALQIHHAGKEVTGAHSREPS